MLFDLRGRRRRAVQATYLMLAVLMGGGLVLFGIGGDVSGGLIDAFKGGGGGGASADSALQDRIDRQEERLAKSPQNEVVLQNLIRDYYQAATGQRESGSVGFPADAKDELRKAGDYWQRYIKAVKREPSAEAASYALQVYDVSALNRPKEAQKAAAIIAQDANDVASYLRLVSYATLAGDKRTADLAAEKAVDLAPKAERKQVKQQAEALKKPPQQQPAGG
jgi:translation initiation factor 2B subunit (eIF-2B alpha/beta/delta family)